MKTASAFSVRPGAEVAANEALDGLMSRLGATPDLLFLYATQHHAEPALLEAIGRRLPGVPVVGGTSCGGVMTEAGFHTGPDGALGLFGICDREGSYGVGAAEIGVAPHAAGAAAIQAALAAAGRDFEAPTLVWCCQPPGQEEAVLEGIQSVIGRTTPIIGGSSADEAIAGQWRQFSPQGVTPDHAVVAVLFPTTAHGAAFQSGYTPSGHSGIVTRAGDRQILEIDHQPAATLYSRWTEGAVSASDRGMILAQSTATPLGRIAAEVEGVPMFVLSHPALMGSDGDVSLFTDIAVGDRIHLMRGSPDSLVKRGGAVVANACATGGWPIDATRGGLVIYCGGCMLHVRERMDEVVQGVRDAIGPAPFLGAHTFGEQGAIMENCNRHGNLMVSALTFG
ncbi:FIST N-terminal domain-containing protein [Phenylobacterium sp.]|uniref:FIST signal transduction protein n=1 Tax=Phenylobacterium sp. TaxID=1871053 RepID=UPI00286A7ABA|nr:FIST N-terminal domain-containing protein [Phenylobacterium sp.]